MGEEQVHVITFIQGIFTTYEGHPEKEFKRSTLCKKEKIPSAFIGCGAQGVLKLLQSYSSV